MRSHQYIPIVVNRRTWQTREVGDWTDYAAAQARALECAEAVGWVPAVARDTRNDDAHQRLLADQDYLPAFTYLEEFDA